VAIYLDTNALYGWNSFGELPRLALSLVADQLGQDIVLSELVVDEAAHNYCHSLHEVLDEYAKSVEKLNRYFGVIFSALLEPGPDIDGAERTWRRRVDQWATTIETTGDHALGGMHREIHRIRPAKDSEAGPGAGCRDAAIWLAIAAHHRESGQPGHLITKDPAFAEDGRLHPSLAAEIVESRPMKLYPDVQSFVSQLGRYVDGNIDIVDLTQRGATAVIAGLEFLPEVRHSVWFEDSMPLRQRNDITHAEAVRVIRARNYSSRDTTISLVNAEWRVVADVLWQNGSSADDSLWNVLSDIPLTGQIQLYLDNERAQMIGAQLRSPTSALIRGDAVCLIGGRGETDVP
jgi:hypothetical protein